MPVSWRISHGLIWLESDEAATFEEWQSAIEAALAHPDHRPGMGVIHDWRRLRAAPSTDEIRARARYGATLGPIRWALVVPGDASYGMGRMAEILTEQHAIELRTFRDLAEAEAWARGG